MNHYDVLEVSRNASPDVIRAAYKSLMQRYHPDKNPGDAAIAERASLVVQAYEVLSSPDRRSAYDHELRKLTAGRPGSPRNPTPRTRPSTGSGKTRDDAGFWPLFIAIALIVVAGGATTRLLKQELPPNAESGTTRPASNGPAQGMPDKAGRGIPDVPETPPGAGEADAPDRTVIRVATGLLAMLKSPDEGALHVLRIPVVDVRVGTADSDNAIRHLGNIRESVVLELQEKLTGASYEELLKRDGQQYLARQILKIVREASGTGRQPDAASPDQESPARYGAVEVMLPGSYSIR